MPTLPAPVRRGIPKNFTLDVDAVELLQHVLAPGQKSYGRIISELIRSEVDRRALRQELVAAQTRGDHG